MRWVETAWYQPWITGLSREFVRSILITCSRYPINNIKQGLLLVDLSSIVAYNPNILYIKLLANLKKFFNTHQYSLEFISHNNQASGYIVVKREYIARKTIFVDSDRNSDTTKKSLIPDNYRNSKIDKMAVLSLVIKSTELNRPMVGAKGWEILTKLR